MMTPNEPTTEDLPPVNAGEPTETEETKTMREKIAHLEKQNDELLRHLADYQNRHKEMQAVVKRNSQEVEARQKFAHEKFAMDMLSVLDNLQRALDAAEKAGDKSPLTVGVMATQAQIGEVLKRHGITPINALNQPFDPNLHQAIQSQPAGPGVEPNTVTNVVQQGYMIHDRVMRPAAVVVAQSG
ncbi:nucleotide exchange factor GrpE [Zavarzinella formosa]|uniref:nucleotide exchange factor GrpE n=1 Tax=Zavarzinella formosa TaxID=360055 RepID=UPI000300900D|nr:nucleotide exchange factor GrpE [Zavarzinella formosa]